MIEVGTNFICRPYRGVSVQEVTCSLDVGSLSDFLLGRNIYRRTEFLVLLRQGDVAVVQVEKASTAPLFSPVIDLRYLAGPGEATLIDDEKVDTANPTQMASAALASGYQARIYVVMGRFQHVNFIVDPSPVEVSVIEVIPPEPPKLLEMARKVVDYDETLPPTVFRQELVDLRSLASSAVPGPIVFPCRSSGLKLDVPTYFLDSGPAKMQEWTLVGCERSREIHDLLYEKSPSHWINMCPRNIGKGKAIPTLTKCCLREEGIHVDGARVEVPWGATLEEVRMSLHELLVPAVNPGVRK